MKRLHTLLILLLGCSSPAIADVWKWVDTDGNTHFVDSDKPIYTWIDEGGKRYYSDTPDHEDAISVELVWHSEGTLADLQDGAAGESDDDEDSESGGYAYPGETAEQRAEREAAEAYYCKRATEIYDSYINAPRLYRTSDGGEREYLSEEEAESTIAETRAKMEKLCRGVG
jgi:hypothetical protein